MPASGDIEPQEPGAWLSTKEGERATGINWKTLYRQGRRGNRPCRGEGATFRVWIKDTERRSSNVPDAFPERVPDAEEPSDDDFTDEERRHLAVIEQREQFLELLDRATATLGRQVQELTEEREQARRERDEERIRRQLAEADRQQMQAERDRALADAEAMRRRRFRWWPF